MEIKNITVPKYIYTGVTDNNIPFVSGFMGLLFPYPSQADMQMSDMKQYKFNDKNNKYEIIQNTNSNSSQFIRHLNI